MSSVSQVPFLDLQAQYAEIKSEIDSAIATTISEASFILGGNVRLFEDAFREWNGSNHCIGCANGTDALEIALEALGVGDGDHVIVPAMTWISTAEAVVRAGAVPVFVDIDPITYCLDLKLTEESITAKTKAIIAVHLYGYPADVIAMKTLCESKGIFLIEDCAQAHGAKVSANAKVGTIGDIGTFSFFPGKNLGAYGDAGCIITNDAELARICRQIGNHGQIKKHTHVRIGRNSRLDGIQAAILLAKLPHLDEWLQRRQAVANSYFRKLMHSEIILPDNAMYGFHAYHLFVILSDRRDNLLDYLLRSGVSASVHYPNVLPQLEVFTPYLEAQVSKEYPVASKLAACAISLPISDQLSHADIELTCECLNGFFGNP